MDVVDLFKNEIDISLQFFNLSDVEIKSLSLEELGVDLPICVEIKKGAKELFMQVDLRMYNGHHFEGGEDDEEGIDQPSFGEISLLSQPFVFCY